MTHNLKNSKKKRKSQGMAKARKLAGKDIEIAIQNLINTFKDVPTNTKSIMKEMEDIKETQIGVMEVKNIVSEKKNKPNKPSLNRNHYFMDMRT